MGGMLIIKRDLSVYAILGQLMMATGLAVDYSVYLSQKFMLTPGSSRNERVREVLSEYGLAIFKGGLTALIGTVPLAFASSKVLRTFFALMFGTILFSLLVGMVLMPVLFSLVGPQALPLQAVVHNSSGGGDSDNRSQDGGNNTRQVMGEEANPQQQPMNGQQPHA